MSNIITQSQSDSPFDSIRHFDDKGNEFWYARELMPLLAYKQWRRFNEVIMVAVENLETITSSTVEHFLPLEAKTQGRPKLDYKLSRLACYHVALCCDSRGNDAVKSAKHYFAIKTREAEVIIPAQNERLLMAQLEIEKLQLENENLRLKKDYMERRDAIRELHGVQMLALLDGRPDAVIEKIEKVTETVIVKDGRNVSFEGQSTAQLGKSLGFKTGKELELWLEKIGREDLICQGFRACPAPYIPTENIKEVKKIWADGRTKNRQLIIGE